MNWSGLRTVGAKLLWPVLAFAAGAVLVHLGWLGSYYSDWAASLECRDDNLRMLHHAFESYAEEHDGLLPPDRALRELAGNWSVSGGFVHCDLSGPLGPYIGADTLMLCDGDPELVGPDGPGPSYVWNREIASEQWSNLEPGTWLVRDRGGWHWGQSVNAITVAGTLTSWRYRDGE